MVKTYAILDSTGRCINRVLWDGQSAWQPPTGCTAVEDSENLYPVAPAVQDITEAETVLTDSEHS